MFGRIEKNNYCINITFMVVLYEKYYIYSYAFMDVPL